MPPKKNSQKNKAEGYHKPKKRKVISPIQISEHISTTKGNNSGKRNNKKGNNDNNGRLNEQSSQQSGTCVSPDSDQV